MQLSKTTLRALRIAGFAVSIFLLVFLLKRIHAKALAAAFHTMEVGWFLLAMLLFGFLFVPATSRWKIALKATGSHIRFLPALRLSLIGHFFYTILLGAAGGDAAKSALYSRWNGLPLTKILAASSIDRLLGMVGLIVFTAFAFGLAASRGGLENLGSMSVRWPAWWLLLVVAAVGLVIGWIRRSPIESPQRRFLKTLSESSRKLMRSPSDFSTGILCGILVQASLSGVLALCLNAVSVEPIPWAQLAWTFPVISVVSALPVTFAGLGVRDSASVVLFGLCHVPASTAIAASLLTAAVSLAWTVVGAGLLWWEISRNEPDFQFRNFSTFLSRGTAR
jgi:uncharacterized protein (TIRG00374 family)